MAQDQGQERTEQPTTKRLTEARRRGQVPKSADLVAAVTLILSLVFLKFFGLHLLNRLVSNVRYYLSLTPTPLNVEQLDKITMAMIRALLETAAPFLLAMAVGGLIVLYAQVGWLFTLKPLEMKFTRLNPVTGLRRLLSLSSLVKLGMSLAKTSVVVLVAFLMLRKQLNAIVASSALPHNTVVGLGAKLVYELGMCIGLALLILALLDYAYQRWKHKDNLKMTKQEIKEEMRQMEGDPVVKRRQRQVQFQLALQRIRAAVPQADVVVTNPTQLAIALKYDPELMSAPKVVAKGKGLLAQRIREIAVEAGVPVVERKLLAQAMFKMVEIGQEIPPQFYKAVAEILAFVYELAGRGHRRGPSPVPAGA